MSLENIVTVSLEKNSRKGHWISFEHLLEERITFDIFFYETGVLGDGFKNTYVLKTRMF